MVNPASASSPSARAPLLQAIGISKRYGSFLANDSIDLDLYTGEIHALLGENGAGKSTLVKTMYGLIQPSAGELHFLGEKLELTGPSDARAKGIAMGELTFISGHPGTTFRQQTHAQMRYAQETGIPFQLKSMDRQKAALQALAATSPEARRISADAIYGIENGHKRLSGQLLGLAKPENLKKVAEAEASLQASVAADPALKARVAGSWDRVAQAVARQRELLKENTYLSAGRVTLLGHALNLVRLADELVLANAMAPVLG
ncbi:MAG: S46 family peptidase, partial [Betaproteobacteria bacterium]